MSESVFPQSERTTQLHDGSTLYESFNAPRGGLTKRELFAAMAIQGIITANVPMPGVSPLDSIKASALAAKMYADALIAELAKEKP